MHAEDTAVAFTALPAPTFSPLVERYIRRYEVTVGSRRALWPAASELIARTALSSVPAHARARHHDTKMLAVMLNVLLDDLAHRPSDARLLERALALPTQPAGTRPETADLDRVDAAHLTLIATTRDAIQARLRGLRGYALLGPLLRFDYQQVVNGLRYARLAAAVPGLSNPSERELYRPPALNLMLFVTLDLMVSPGFDMAELGTLRAAVCSAQCMAQADARSERWRAHRRELLRQSRLLRSVDLRPLISGLEALAR